jgi:hypothetical protein
VQERGKGVRVVVSEMCVREGERARENRVAIVHDEGGNTIVYVDGRTEGMDV